MKRYSPVQVCHRASLEDNSAGLLTILDRGHAVSRNSGSSSLTRYLFFRAGQRHGLDKRFFEIESRGFNVQHLLQSGDAADMIVFCLKLPESVEVTEVCIRPREEYPD